MLKHLAIQNIVLAENLQVEFDKGLNVITGETGAGKSLLVDALAFLRGAKFDPDMIRHGCEQASVCGSFCISERIAELLEVHGIPNESDELVLRRVLSRHGKHKAFVNDVPVSLKVFAEFGTELVDISSQFENQKLLDVQNHAFYLDLYADLLQVSKEYRKMYLGAHEALKKLQELTEVLAKNQRERDLYEFEVNEIQSLNPDKIEFEELQKKVQFGERSQNVLGMCSEIEQLLFEGDSSCLVQFKQAKKMWERMRRLLPALEQELSEQDWITVLAALDEVAVGLSRVRDSSDLDESQLVQAAQRLDEYHRLLKKFGPDIEGMLKHQQRCLQELEKQDLLGDEIAELKKSVGDYRDRALSLAMHLSVQRQSKSSKLAKAVSKELADLGMDKIQFHCKFLPYVAAGGSIQDDTVDEFAKLGALGKERVQFFMSTNVGEEAKSIERIASGGELSRIMLAIKNTLFEDDVLSVFVFDEIDTGIGGPIAAKVGRKLAEFCRASKQVICITHLPQVACFSDAHFVVSKSTSAGRTVTKIQRATMEEKVQELAIMLSGDKVTKESLAQAKRLVAEARA